MARIGVFVCHCGTNIAATVDVKKVADHITLDVDHSGLATAINRFLF